MSYNEKMKDDDRYLSISRDMHVNAVLCKSMAYKENTMLTNIDEMPSRTAKFNKSNDIWAIMHYIDTVEHMSR